MGEVISLQDYRTRYAQYKLDSCLRKVHQRHPFIHIWDDHEISNDAYKDGALEHNEIEDGNYSERKENATRAFFEWVPVKNHQKLYRDIRFGNLAQLFMLDGRLEGRTEQQAPSNEKFYDDDRSVLGKAQLNWLTSGLKNSNARWKLIGNPVLFSSFDFSPVRKSTSDHKLDKWSGYPYEQNFILDFIAKDSIKNTVFISRDSHSSWFFDIPHNDNLSIIAHEVGVPALSSSNWGTSFPEKVELWEQELLAINPFLKYVDLKSNGYTQIEPTNDTMSIKWFKIDKHDINSEEQLINQKTMERGKN